MSGTAADTSKAISVSKADTDELLSQLAGSEIDRLLAEANDPPPKLVKKIAEVKAPPAQAAAPQPATTKTPVPLVAPEPDKEDAPADSGALNQQLDQLFTQLDVPSAPAKEPVDDAAPSNPPPDIAENDATDTAGAEKSALLAAAGFDTDEPAGIAETDTHADADPNAGSVERDALLAAAGFDSAEEVAEQTAILAQEQIEAMRPTPLVRVLELINSPIRQFGPTLRTTMGWAAIITLVNGLAILGYVMLARRH